MTGICAGDAQDVQLGDLVVAERTFTYDNGKFTLDEYGRRVHLHDTMTYQLDANILQFLGLFDNWKPLVASMDRPLSVPEQREIALHLKPMASGNAVRSDRPFEDVRVPVRGTVAIDMEGAAFGLVMSRHPLIPWLVVKGVCDYANRDKNDAYHDYTARASALYALSFIRAYVTNERLPRLNGPSPSSRAGPSGVWNVPHRRNPHFIGRGDLLDRLHEQLTPTGQDDLTTTSKAALTPQAIKGLGGTGKTQIAVEYAYRSRDLDRYTYTLWVNAASKEALIASYAAIAELLPAFSAKGETDQQKLVEAVKYWLELCEQRWLLIFDNADDLPIVREYLPRRGNGSILLTTRANAVASVAEPLAVEKMSPAEAMQLLLHRAQRLERASDEEKNAASNIVIALDFLPLALDQAGAYIEETGCCLVDYLHLYQTYRKELLARRGLQTTNYPDAVATTWSLSFQRVEQVNPAAAELLRLCAFLAPDKIPEELIRDGAAHWSPPLQHTAADLFAFNQMIAELLKFSLVERLAETRTLSIHRLVQAVLKDAMDTTMVRQWVERTVCAVNAAFPEPDFIQWTACERYLPHVLICVDWITQEHLVIPETIHLLNHAGSYLYEHARYEEAESLYEQALAIQDQCITSDYSDKASLLSNLASAYEKHGRYAEAEPLFVQALVIYEQQLGPEHPETANGLHNLAHLYENQGRYGEAEPLYQRALGICEQQLGATHLQTAQCLDGFAGLCRKRGKYTSVESLYQRALAICEQQRGLEDPQTATICHNLAQHYEEQGRYGEAEPFYQHALTIYERHLGREHRNTAACLVSLANLYWHQSRYAEAEPLCERALAWNERYLGPDHPSTATSLNTMASLYERQGQYEKAEPLYQRALAIRKQLLGPDHADTAGSLNNLAYLYSMQGRYTEAEPLFEQALVIREQQLGLEHPLVAFTLNNLASLHLKQGRYVEAESLYLGSLRVQEQSLDIQHPDMATLLLNLVTLYFTQGRYTEAEPLYQRALQNLKQASGPKYFNVVPVLKSLAQLCSEHRKYAEAELLYQQALRTCEQALGPEHPEVASPLNSLGTLYREQGKYGEAEPLYERALRILEQAQQPEHPLVAAALNNLANLYREQGKHREAGLLYERALCLWEQALGSGHPLVAYLLYNLAVLHQGQGKYSEAKSLCERALHILEQTLAPAHPDLAEILHNLAVLQELQGNHEESRSFYERALWIREQALGLAHPKTVNTRERLHTVLQAMDKAEEAAHLDEEQAAHQEE